MLELESLSAVGALESPQDGGLVVRDHVPLQPVHVGELLLAHLADLQANVDDVVRTVFISVETVCMENICPRGNLPNIRLSLIKNTRTTLNGT